TRGTRKQVRPAFACASTRKASDCGAEQNHLCPVSAQVPSESSSARVVLARTSEPPCFSVIAIPNTAPGLSRVRRGSYSREKVRGTQKSAIRGLNRSEGTAAWV